MAYDEKLAAPIRQALHGRSDVVEKHMFGGVAFMVRGRMSCGVVGSSLMVRINPVQADALVREPHVRPMDFTGRPMRGFLFVDPPGIATAASLRKWIGQTTAYAEAQPKKGKRQPAARRKRPGGRHGGHSA